MVVRLLQIILEVLQFSYMCKHGFKVRHLFWLMKHVKMNARGFFFSCCMSQLLWWAQTKSTPELHLLGSPSLTVHVEVIPRISPGDDCVSSCLVSQELNTCRRKCMLTWPTEVLKRNQGGSHEEAFCCTIECGHLEQVRRHLHVSFEAYLKDTNHQAI